MNANTQNVIPVEDINRGIMTALDRDEVSKVAQAATDFTRYKCGCAAVTLK